MDIIANIEAGNVTLSGLIDSLAEKYDYPYTEWSRRYRELTQLLQQTQSLLDSSADDLVKRLWYERDNGIASIRQGVPSSTEFQQNLRLLRELTERIYQQPDEQTYQYVENALLQAKETGQLKRMYWSLRNRVFAAFSPKTCTTAVDDNAFTKATIFLNDQFSLGLTPTGSWLQRNYELKQALNTQLPDTDPYYSQV